MPITKRNGALYVRALLFAVIYGWMEQYLFRQGVVLDKSILNQFSWYHLGLGALFIIVCLPGIQLLPLMVLLEDITFFLFHPTASLNPDSWVNWIFGGFYLFGEWIPGVYLILILLYISAEMAVEYFAKRG